MKPIDENCIENVSKILAELTTGSKITVMFQKLGLKDFDETRRKQNSLLTNSTKWRRIKESIISGCQLSNDAKPLFNVISYIMNPPDFFQDPDKWHRTLQSLNEKLMFYGYEINDAGEVESVNVPKTFSEAQRRLQTLKNRLSKLDVHPEILKYCNSELLQENYFHAIFEASKCVLQKIRDISELNDDCNSLVNECFNTKRPIVLIKGNMLKTQTEKSKYLGLKSLLNTIVYLYRNPKAHDPKLYDVTSETDAITALTLMSLAYGLLEKCINVRNLD
ncbi:TIGR02391 family protein [Secundilactobacillus folii]|uniref:TIGR02391 family protein n=1 Tax=Secundilactobacillus folii TaxID=2678357 RepID=A0A7X3C330_9LACO|nr:TIGR02391 family protein [Secundilactobacillus folii]MTV82201.1 TIGR02391 family protein [Secundilactobacillus folii]